MKSHLQTNSLTGSYMKALRPDVLQAGLEIQDALLGPTVDFNPRLAPGFIEYPDLTSFLSPDVRDSFHAANGVSAQSWFFHSPLLYWSCSAKAIAEDDDILKTINERARSTTSVNVTLRHSIVFSGKRFEDHRLVAADALVITLIHMIDSPVGRQWEKQAELLAQQDTERWRIYPKNGRIAHSQLYEFKFQPLSFQDDLFLGVAYALTTIYFLLSLTRLRALKSRFGLTLTVITQILLSIMSSFTICAIFKIDLSKIPREAYPLVVLTIGLENMFRLINAVIVTPASSKTSTRIAEALGQTGHVALAAVTQNLLILYLLHKVVSPGVAAFCVFAAIAISLDFLFLLSFFVAVLSVDVRRTELSDSLDNAEKRQKCRTFAQHQEKPKWVSTIIRGEAPVSTRIAGTIVMIGFILVLQWHFFDNEHLLRTLARLFPFMKKGAAPPPAALISIDVAQARTPTSWLGLQDHETAREVIRVIKPNSYSYIAQVYDPLVVVLNGSDRTPSDAGVRLLLPAVYDFVRNQSTIFIMSIIFTMAAVTLLMNYLLWDEEGSSEHQDEDGRDEPLLSVTTLAQGHSLDVAMLISSPDGVIVSVGLDRRIKVWDLRQETRTHLVASCNGDISPFPVLATALDDQARWLAILSATGRIMLWNIDDRNWGPYIDADIKGRAPLSFFFRPSRSESIAPLILIRSSGMLIEIDFSLDGAHAMTSLQLCKSPLICARQFLDKFATPAVPGMSAPLRIVTASRRGCVHIASQLPEKWISDGIELYAPDDDKEVVSVLPLPVVGLFLAIRSQAVDLVHVKTRTIIHTFQNLQLEPDTLQCLHSVKRKPHCGLDGLASFSLIYTERETGNCVIRNFVPPQEGELICIGPRKCNSDVTCISWSQAIEKVHQIDSPGMWHALATGLVVGVRKTSPSRPPSRDFASSPRSSTSSLRRRGGAMVHPQVYSPPDEDIWEAWMLSPKGEKLIVPLLSKDDGQHADHQLLVSTCGPMAKVGRRSVAVAFGNVIKIITVGHERFDTGDDSSEDVTLAMAGRRRKPLQGKRSNV
jgi:WD40 repeat protein